MPAIRDWTFNFATSTSSTTIVGNMPNYEQYDLLVAILSQDTGTPTWSSSGWSVLFNTTDTCNLSVLYKIAGASETDTTFTTTVAETLNVHMVSIRDVHTSSPFNGTGGAGTGYRTATNSAARVAMPVLTTTVNDSLILYLNSESGAVVPGVLEGPCTFEAAADGSAHSNGFSWGVKRTAGATPTVYGNKNGTAAGVIATVGISPPAEGASVIPAYCAGDASIYVDPIHGTSAYNGNSAFSATTTTYFGTTLNGVTLGNGTVTSILDYGLNSFHSMARVLGVVTSGVWRGGCAVPSAGNRPNVTGKNVLIHMTSQTPKDYQNIDSISRVGAKGIAFGMCSTAASAYRVWHVHGSGTAWDTSTHVPLIIHTDNTSGRIQNTGSFSSSSVVAFGCFVSGKVVAPNSLWGSLWVLDTTTICGGNSTEPIGVNGIYKVCSLGKERMSVLQQGASQLLLMQPIQIGNGGTDPAYLLLDSTAIEVPAQYNLDKKQVFYCSVDNVAGITYYAGASDTIIHRNSVISSDNKFHWKFHASSSGSATYDFSGLSVIGAGTITLHASVNLTEVTWNKCDEITAVGNTLTGCNFIASTGTNGSISITGANQSALQTALSKLVDCYWTNNTTPLGALRIIYTGSASSISLNMTSGYFSGNTYNIRWEAPASSPLTINASGTCNLIAGTTYTATNSNTVTVVAGSVTVNLIAQTITGTLVQDAQVLVAVSAAGTLPYNASVTITNSGTTATVTHNSHGLSTGDKVKIKGASHYQNNGVFAITKINDNSYSYTLPSAPGSNPTGTITSTFVFLYGVTDVNGEITMSRVVSTNQAVSGWARKSSSEPYYKTAPVSGTVSSTSGASFSALMIPDA